MNKEISAREAANLNKNNPSTVLLDVREHSELTICRIEGALHIPMDEIPERHEALPRDTPLVIFCHHGMRSMSVAQFLWSKGFTNVVNMAGGIHAWAIDVNPELAHY
jgi:rhodanese-related sulfurtransferase